MGIDSLPRHKLAQSGRAQARKVPFAVAVEDAELNFVMRSSLLQSCFGYCCDRVDRAVGSPTEFDLACIQHNVSGAHAEKTADLYDDM